MSESGVSVRVAIVEDHALYRDLLESSLAAVPGVTVIACVSGSTEAKIAIQPGAVDVAILDIELADGNGIGLGVSLRRADPHLGIVLLSGRHDRARTGVTRERATRMELPFEVVEHVARDACRRHSPNGRGQHGHRSRFGRSQSCSIWNTSGLAHATTV